MPPSTPNFQSVTETASTVVVVGAASSLRGVDLSRLNRAIERGARVVAVNDMGWHTPRTDWITHHLEVYEDNLPTGCIVHAPQREESFRDVFGVRSYRMVPLPDAPPYAWHDPGLFYQGNSGFHAIQLAVKMRVRTLIILGVDARASGYMLPAWEAKPRDDFKFVTHLTRLLLPDLADVRVIYGSPEGTLPFPRTTPEEALAALGV